MAHTDASRKLVRESRDVAGGGGLHGGRRRPGHRQSRPKSHGTRTSSRMGAEPLDSQLDTRSRYMLALTQLHSYLARSQRLVTSERNVERDLRSRATTRTSRQLN